MAYSLTRATVWNIAGYSYLILASFISTPFLIRGLTLPIFAQYTLILATLALTSSLDLGLPQAVVRELVRARNQLALRRAIWASSSILFLSSGFLIALITSAVSYYLGLASIYILLVFGLIIMQNLTSHYATLPQAEGHFGFYNTKTFIVGTANTLLAAYLSNSGFGLVGVLAALLFSYVITLFPLAYFSLKLFPKPWTYQPSMQKCRELISFGLRNQAGKLVGQIQSQYSKYLLAAASPISLTGYVLAQGLIQKTVGGVNAISSALYPRSSESSDDSKLRSIYLQLQLGLFGLGLIGVIIYYIFGQKFLLWWLNDPQLVAIMIKVLNVLIWYFVLLIPTPLASTILDGRGKPELTSIFAFITTAFEITLALVLYPQYGFMAPVYGATIALILTTPALLYCSTRVLQSKS